MRVFGLEWKIYDRAKLWQIIADFGAAGFSFLSPKEIEDSHIEQPILFQGQSYTFVLVALRAPDEGKAHHLGDHTQLTSSVRVTN
jgi:hypothetical protein